MSNNTKEQTEVIEFSATKSNMVHPQQVWNVTSQQPTIQQNNLVAGSYSQRDWSLGLCGCFGDCKGLLCSWFCYPIYMLMTYSKAGQGFCDCLFGGPLPLRVKVRTERGISGSICGDVFATACCPCCSLIQVAHEVENTKPLI
ncbi:unnamed protein product [Brachionus calyciflorus]|uniref:Uncharacterized protein n=1 Tax=Brachionus calyciflorus TaxID=104777 RepID=A0A814AEL7_9BILA|nr:unnamed protein product [Brachionus calyciflorus]